MNESIINGQFDPMQLRRAATEYSIQARRKHARTRYQILANVAKHFGVDRDELSAQIERETGKQPVSILEEMRILEDEAKAKAESRGWLTGDINQTDVWFRS